MKTILCGLLLALSLLSSLPARAIDYSDAEQAEDLIEPLWSEA